MSQFLGASSIKSIQRGTTASAGNVTISAVNMAKTMILSASKGSAGTVAATGTIASTTYSGAVHFGYGGARPTTEPYYSNNITEDGTIAATSISAGTTNLIVKVYSATLTNATTINCDGPVEWQVIEHA